MNLEGGQGGAFLTRLLGSNKTEVWALEILERVHHCPSNCFLSPVIT